MAEPNVELIVQIMRERDELMSRALSAEARLAEVEAERDREASWRNITADRFQREHQRANAATARLAAVLAAEARLAEVEAERANLRRDVVDLQTKLVAVGLDRDRWEAHCREMTDRNAMHWARLAAVLALCERATGSGSFLLQVGTVRAAATGEDARH